MADRYLLESGAPDGYLLEDGTGVYLLNNGVVWDPAASHADYSIDDTGLIAAKAANAANGSQAQANTVKATGYFEAKATPNAPAVGLVPSGAANNNWVGFVANSIGYHSGGTVYRNNVNFATYATFGTTDTVMCALKLVSATLYVFFGVNGVWQSGTDPSAGTGGIDVTALFSSAVPAISANNVNDATTGHFTSADLIYSIPTGLTAWDGTVALSGQSISAAQGSVSGSVTAALTGQSLSVGQGTVLQGAPLVGQSISVAQASAAPATSIALTGQTLTAARGTVTATTATALSGQIAAIGQGSVLQGAPITGQNAVAAIGSAVPIVSIALIGQTLAGAIGSVSPASSLALSGQALTVARGSVVAVPGLTLTGQGVSAAQGSVPASSSIAITGGALAVAQGTVAAAVPGSAALTGQSVVTARGTASPATSVALTGQSIATAQNILASATSLGIAGQQTTVGQGAVVAASNDVTVALTGVAALLAQGAVTPQFIAALVGSGLTTTPGTISGGLHLEYPLADIPQHRPNDAANQGYPLTAVQTRPLTATQHRPLEGVPQRYPLEAA